MAKVIVLSKHQCRTIKCGNGSHFLGTVHLGNGGWVVVTCKKETFIVQCGLKRKHFKGLVLLMNNESVKICCQI